MIAPIFSQACVSPAVEAAAGAAMLVRARQDGQFPRVAPNVGRRKASDELMPRRNEVLRLRNEGLRVSDIADRLGCASTTVAADLKWWRGVR